MHIYLAKSSWFKSTNFASVMIDDIGCSRRHQCPQCDYPGATKPPWRLNRRPLDCLFPSMHKPVSKKHQGLQLLTLCEGNQPMSGGKVCQWIIIFCPLPTEFELSIAMDLFVRPSVRRLATLWRFSRLCRFPRQNHMLFKCSIPAISCLLICRAVSVLCR